MPRDGAATPGGPGTGGGPLGNLPSQVPDGVRNMLEGIFNFGGDLGHGFGEFVSGLAGAIGGDGGAAMVAPELVQATISVSEVVV